MDYFPISMFQYEQGDDQLLQISSIIPGQPDQLPVLTTSQDGCDLTDKLDHSRRRKSSITNDETDHENHNDKKKKKKKIIHRDIERQRRQEMATLHANLQSLLPVEYIKGKRSMSDHMHEVVNYIKHLQNKIQEQNNKRDELKRLSNYPIKATEKSLGSGWDSLTELRPSSTGVEVAINARQGLPLSRVVEVLMGEGLIIAGFTSTKVNERLLHTIEAELSDGQSIDLCELEKKLKYFTICSSN
ncbi:transcription factor bHLH118-like isoform X2 [Alnus glutinosa]|uniref:transcription factor bHLH118-like isoform X2 n=1 Tax=Alnus glutinosa TaxID=3517 RepID=UPI002D77C175|nr:transcription factor bHLH118-like isoform X2 [Alnus glutinosa]